MEKLDESMCLVFIYVYPYPVWGGRFLEAYKNVHYTIR